MKDIKLRIRSMESTKQITKAMEMVAASKLRRAQENVTRSRPYFEILFDTVCDIADSSPAFTSPYLEEREIKKTCYVVIAGDRGLAGGYNHNVLKLAEAEMAGKNVTVVPIGKRCVENFRAHGYEILTDAWAEAGGVSVSDCFTMARDLSDRFLNGEFDEVNIVYTNFVSILVQQPAIMRILPLHGTGSGEKHQSETVFEPGSQELFARIVPEYVGGLIYGALCECIASEQGARRTAMDSATKNAEEMIDDLSLKYNRARQGAITQEITEIVAGSNT